MNVCVCLYVSVCVCVCARARVCVCMHACVLCFALFLLHLFGQFQVFCFAYPADYTSQIVSCYVVTLIIGKASVV